MGRNRRGESPQKYHRVKKRLEKRKSKKTKGDAYVQANVTGTVKRFFGDHGFLVRDDGGGEVFLHITDLLGSGRNSVDPGKGAVFDVVERNGRLCATNIRFMG